MAPNDAWPSFAAPVYGGIAPQIQAAAAAAAPLSDLQAEGLAQARSLNASLPDDFQVQAPLGLDQAAVAGAFVQAVGNAAIAAHQQVKS
jgi:hypothetical protein